VVKREKPRYKSPEGDPTPEALQESPYLKEDKKKKKSSK